MIERLRISISQFITKFRSNSFWNNVAILAGGSGLAQVIAIAITPLLTRLYSPEEFGVLTVLLSTLSIFVVVASLRYEVAIPLPNSSETAAQLLGLSSIIVLITTSISILAILLWQLFFTSSLPLPKSGDFLWVLPIGIFLGGSFQILTYWHIRERKFRNITKANILQSSSKALTQLGTGVIHLGYWGLISGFILGRTVAVGILLYYILSSSIELVKTINIAGIKKAAVRYRRFPLLSSLSALLNQSGAQIAPLLFAFFWGAQVAGWFGLAQRIGSIPIGLVGRSVSQVYLSESSRLRNQEPGKVKKLFVRTALRLFFYIGLPVLSLGLLSPWLFGIIFGPEWKTSGFYIVAMLPVFLGQIVVSPLAQTMNVLEKQDVQLIWDLSRVLIITAAISIAHYILHWDSLSTLFLYGFIMLGMYIILFLIMWRQINQFYLKNRSLEEAK